MTAALNTQEGRGALVIDFTGQAAVGAAGSIANPEGAAVLITECYWNLITPSTAAATLDIGIGATGADSSDIVSAIDIQGEGAGTTWQGLIQSTASEGALASPFLWASGTFLNFFTAAASSVGCTARLLVNYIRVG
jgi:hypothetical protein